MYLETSFGWYAAHFMHQRVQDGPNPPQSEHMHWETTCVLHPSKCTKKGCGRDISIIGDEAGVGIAGCDSRDEFTKERGRILSFTRAMCSLHETERTSLRDPLKRKLRTELWAAYKALSPIKGNRKRG